MGFRVPPHSRAPEAADRPAGQRALALLAFGLGFRALGLGFRVFEFWFWVSGWGPVGFSAAFYRRVAKIGFEAVWFTSVPSGSLL